MPDAFKNLINHTTVRDTAQALQMQWPALDRQRFEQMASQGLDELEMKARAMQIAEALDACLPVDLHAAASLIEAALAPVRTTDADAGDTSGPGAGLNGWVVWSLGEFVARRVERQPADLHRGLDCLHALTQRFTAEFAIRPLLRDHPSQVWPVLARWAADPSPAVRRLASEGSRPRLPWGLRLHASVRDPSPAFDLLEKLQDDPDEVVRRSVANHLNDIAKDHPELLADWLDRHLPGASPARQALLRHASRTLIKQGHPRVMAAWGLGRRFKGDANFSITPARAEVGESVELALTLRSGARQAQTLVIDYAVHHVTARGQTSAKVFKGWKLTLAAGETRTLSRRHSLKPITTRRYYAGWHAVTVQANGAPLAEAGFHLD
ncbi:DNA alkylation repair protein [Ideonella sp. DXS29W]|uniref:DNA alkylation repair protein n=1 Tax=Ideonella lacteola TaxID=2984193 RepID=A0ABU9BRY3_9BURK